MKLKIKNINKVKEAVVNLNGLTVIAGANSSGKSTVGKLLFSMIKAMSNAELLSSQTHEKKLQKRVDSLYSRASNCFSRQDLPNIEDLMPLPANKMTEKLLSLPDDEAVEAYLNSLSALFASVDLTPRLRTLFDQDIDNIRIAMGDSVAADVASEIRVFIESEFMGKITSYGCEDSEAILELDTPEDKLELKFHSDAINRVNTLYNEVLSDATYVESPLYMHILDTLLLAATYREGKSRRNVFSRGMVPIHIKDLATKISAMQYLSSDNDMGIDIESIIGGNFEIEKETQRLIFRQKGQSVPLSPINIASGIKTFGLVQILLQTGIISPDKPLIWDEPENHLHPEWQINFAKILVLLSKSGIPVVISTHSPYFVQGIRYYSAMYDLENYTNYYLADVQSDQLSIMRDVSSDLNQIFSKLATPLSEIMNVDMVRRESMK